MPQGVCIINIIMNELYTITIYKVNALFPCTLIPRFLFDRGNAAYCYLAGMHVLQGIWLSSLPRRRSVKVPGNSLNILLSCQL